MTTHPSVSRRLGVGLVVIALLSTAVLMAAVLTEYGLGLSDLADPRLFDGAWNEMVDHVGLPVLVMLGPMLVATTLFIGRAFSPLHRAASLIETIPAERGVRIPVEGFPVEALPFAEAINRLLGRLDETARQQEAFAADVAHELRTPLAIMAMELERSAAVDGARLRDEVAAMRRLIDQLMLLAQVNAAEASPMPGTRFALADLAGDVCAALAPQIIGQKRHIELQELQPAGEIFGHREAVAAALRNLIENAVRVTPEGGRITVTSGPGRILRVGDEGPGLTGEQLASLVRRHERADHPSSDGAGLGLAIAARITTAHGGTLASDHEAREIMMAFDTKG